MREEVVSIFYAPPISSATLFLQLPPPPCRAATPRTKGAMASLRDAMKRLQYIYEACSPEALAEKGANGKDLDDFTKLKKKMHRDVKQVREVTET